MTRLRNLFRSEKIHTPRRTRRFRPSALDASTLERREVLSTLPAGFTESVIASGMSFTTSMVEAPDGRLFIGQVDGTIRVFKNDQLLPTPFAKFEVDPRSSGLMSVAFDPHFEHNGQVYVYYTIAKGGQERNRLSRVVADGDVMKPGSETILYESQSFNIPDGTIVHNGGGMTFGADGKLYIPTGDMIDSTHAQRLDNTFGKVLRINSDGSIPTDNPFYDVAKGDNRLIYALGFRNPFTIAAQPGTGLIYINDVGAAAYEEINQLAAGANYGWPNAEGPTTNAGYANPIYAYTHHDPDTAFGGTSIVGGAFYNPSRPTFPEAYTGLYFFADHNNKWMKTLDPATGKVTPFAQDLGEGLADIEVTSDGRILYLTIHGELREIEYAPAAPPTIPTLPDRIVRLGETAVFQVAPRGSGPFAYQWQINGENVPGATSSRFEVAGDASVDGAQIRVIAINQYGANVSNAATLRVNTNKPPVVKMTLPRANQVFRIGRMLQFAATATDPEDGRLKAKAFTWTFDVLHNEHVHPEVDRIVGRRSASIRLPNHDEQGVVRFRLNVTVTDSAGNTTTVSREIVPTPAPTRPERPVRPVRPVRPRPAAG